MFVIRLANGNLMAPESALELDGQVVGDAYVEISPSDPQYPRLARQAVTEADMEAARQRWRDGDEALRLEFEQYLAGRTERGGGSPSGGRVRRRDGRRREGRRPD
jgi:hypothetical protein